MSATNSTGVLRATQPHQQSLDFGVFERDALGILIAYAKRHRGRPFSAEEVTTQAVSLGVAPPDLRSWGAVFVRAARDGYIRRSTKLFRRSMGNNTLTPGWVGV